MQKDSPRQEMFIIGEDIYNFLTAARKNFGEEEVEKVLYEQQAVSRTVPIVGYTFLTVYFFPSLFILLTS